MTESPAERPSKMFGWLLAPFVAWAAAFLGGWVGALLSIAFLGESNIGWLLGGGVVGGIGGALVFVRLLKRRKPPAAGDEH